MSSENIDRHLDNKMLIIEPFFGGSHKYLIDCLTRKLTAEKFDKVTMKSSIFHWRARTCALYISQQIKTTENYSVLFCSSVLPLHDLLGLKPQLNSAKKIVFFHENQLSCPVSGINDTGYQYGFNEILSALAADIVLFNSNYNKQSFLSKIDNHLQMQPDYIVTNLCDDIDPKSFVIYFPIKLKMLDSIKLRERKKFNVKTALHIVWPQRWEFDKNIDTIIRVLTKLAEKNHKFQVSLLGGKIDNSPMFQPFKKILGRRLKNFKYIGNIRNYYKVLCKADIVVSTTTNEFFGVSVAEAVYCGCVPLLPNGQVYPEFYDRMFLYNNEEHLYEILKIFCQEKHFLENYINKTLVDNIKKFDEAEWVKKFEVFLQCGLTEI